MEQKMREVVNTLNEAAEAYYNGEEIMSNKEYDSLYEELEAMEEEIGIILSDSPTRKVGAPVADGLPKDRHEYPALSLDKTKDVVFLCKKFEKGCKDSNCDEALIMWKLDGGTVNLTYENGQLIKAVTRGNGEIGSVITRNIRSVYGIPWVIPCPGKVIIRGEVTMSYSEFERINKMLPDDEKYKNPRNLANASVSVLDNKKITGRELHFNAFDLVAMSIGSIERFDDRLETMKKWGVNVVDYEKVHYSELKKRIEEWTNRVAEFDIPVDGLVIALNNVAYADTLPGTEHNPHIMRGYALKWEDETVETTLRKIEWSASRTGLLNPVAVFDPVELEGTTVSRASLFNVSYIKEKQLAVGDKITIYKANKIIPQVDKNLSYMQNPGRMRLTYAETHPVNCPVCGAETNPVISKNGTEVAVCPNEHCSAKMIRKFVHFCERDCMNIEGMSEATIETFVKNGFINEFADFFKLQRYEKEIIEMDGFGQKSYENIIRAAEKARNVNFVSFVHALGIPNIGKGQAKLLDKEFEGNVNDFLEAVANRRFFQCIEGIGEVLEDNLWKWGNEYLRYIPFKNDIDKNGKYPDVNLEIYNLLKEIHIEEKKNTSTNELQGKIFVITGSLNHYENRDALIKVIEEHGGKASGSVSAKTSYLINNDVTSTSGKNKKAKELGIPIISEDDFLAMI